MIKPFRRILLSFIIFVILAALAFFASQLIAWFSIINAPLGDSAASAKAWLDENGNGVWDLSESPLPGVCIWSTISPSGYNEPESICRSAGSRTNDKGIWPGEFFAGSSGENIYIFANAPAGYHSTTPPAAHSTYTEFGFAPDSVMSKNQISSRYEYVQEAAQEEEFAFKLRNIKVQVIFWGTAFSLVALSVFFSKRIDRALIRAGFF
jgi:hypothetical protein